MIQPCEGDILIPIRPVPAERLAGGLDACRGKRALRELGWF